MRKMRYSWLLCGLVALVGCGDGLNVAPVSGVVTLDDQPLGGASITTQPIGQGTRTPGPGSFATTDAQGHFELELVKPARKGAIVGQHRVMISQPTGDSARQGPQKSADGSYEFWTDAPRSRQQMAAAAAWPTEFTNGSQTLDVPAGGTDQARIDLKSPKAGK